MTQSLESLLGQLLRQRGLKLVTAESCTGGLIADRITDVPGSSEYFIGGFVTYAYEAKAASLGVSWDTLDQFGVFFVAHKGFPSFSMFLNTAGGQVSSSTRSI